MACSTCSAWTFLVCRGRFSRDLRTGSRNDLRNPYFQNDSPSGTASIVPLVFPLIVGAGTLTTLLALRAEYHTINIIIALTLNIIVVYFVLKNVSLVEKIFGKGGAYILRKFLGIILLAISVKLFTSNLTSLIDIFKYKWQEHSCPRLIILLLSPVKTRQTNVKTYIEPVLRLGWTF